MKNTLLLCVLTFWMGTLSAQTQNSMTDIIAQVAKQYAPDKRVAIFAVEADEQGVLRGKTNLPEAHKVLLDKLKADKVTFQDQIKLLPDVATLGEQTQGVVTVSVGNIRSTPKHSGELATQALLGTPVKVLERDGEWLSVQTPDGYIAWAAPGSIELMNKMDFEQWTKSRKIIVLTPFGFSHVSPDAEAQTVSDVVAGCVLEWTGQQGDFYQVRYPDGRKAFVAKTSAKPYDEWLALVRPSEDALVRTSKKLMGLPYLWGGTSFKGVDCSGFTKTIYFLNGLVIPRDASQQVHTGAEVIDNAEQYDKLRPGDLLFFGKKAEGNSPEKVVHVGMWLGNGEFIHASGMVKVNSLDPKAPNYNEYERGRFLRAKRLLGSKTAGIAALKAGSVY
jgi:gamma-D-glutamyl-L-lysine dipeptidyl-peptidase